MAHFLAEKKIIETYGGGENIDWIKTAKGI
jgi:hypothetical protein